MTIQEEFGLAAQHRAAGRRSEAEVIYRRILAGHPNHPDALHNLGVLALDARDYAAALGLIGRAVELRPEEANFHCNFGIALRAVGRIEEAVGAYRRAVSLNANDPSIWLNLGNALSQIDQFPQAIEAYRSAIQLNPEYCDAPLNLGNTFHQMGEFDQALASYRRAIALKPDLAAAHYGLATILLLRGDFAAGWLEHESRWNIPGWGLQRPNFPVPMWDGSDLKGRRILIYAEQGLGDAIMFVRYAALVAARGAAKVIVACPPPLKRLFAALPSVDAVITDGDPMPQFDVHCPLMTLPLVFNTTLETIPAPARYLNADPALAWQWKERIETEAVSGRKVGLVWAGRPQYLRDRARSMALSVLEPLAGIPDVHYFSLQKGQAAEQSASPPSGMKWTDWTSRLNDFADTAALVENLDLVIAVDTSVAHLAAAMGKPAWLLLPFVPDWRWLLSRPDSSWYPTVQLFRQSKAGDWTTVIHQVADSLAHQLH